jgi:hypothetical protein
MKEIKIVLTKPVQDGDTSVTEVVMRHKLNYLRGQNIKAGSLNEEVTVSIDLGAILTLAEKMSGITTELMDEMEDEDRGKITAAALDFLLSSLGTGKKPSGR